MAEAKINLAEDGSFTDWISGFGKFSLAADIQIASGITWSTAVVGLEWSMTIGDYANAVTFSPVVSFTTSAKSLLNINIASVVWFRFVVTTAEGTWVVPGELLCELDASVLEDRRV